MLSHARHAALDEREIEKTISAYPEPPHIDHLDTYASDLVRCSLVSGKVIVLELFIISAYHRDFRPRCITLREPEKRRAARLGLIFLYFAQYAIRCRTQQ
jgi:hypothetical protein